MWKYFTSKTETKSVIVQKRVLTKLRLKHDDPFTMSQNAFKISPLKIQLLILLAQSGRISRISILFEI